MEHGEKKNALVKLRKWIDRKTLLYFILHLKCRIMKKQKNLLKK